MKDYNNDVTIIDLVLLILNIYVLIVMGVQTFLTLDPELNNVIILTDNIMCIVFLLDFFRRLFQSDCTRAFMKWGWIDFITSLPMLDFMRWGRIIRVMRLFRTLRLIRSSKQIFGLTKKMRAKNTMMAIAAMSVLVVTIGTILISTFEFQTPDATITNAGDALWWTLVTMSTVGYGDMYPITFAGRSVAIFLMFFGIGIFGSLAAFVTTLVGGEDDNNELYARIDELSAKIDQLNTKDYHE